MIRTVYTDRKQIHDILATLPLTPGAVEAAATIHDLGITIVDSRAELDAVLQKLPDAETRFVEVGGFFFIVHGRLQTLPETEAAADCQQSDLPPKDVSRYCRSHLFWQRAIRYGWYSPTNPYSRLVVRRLLANVLGLHDSYGLSPYRLTDEQFEQAWKRLAAGPPVN